MDAKQVFSLPEDFEVTSVEVAAEALTICIVSTQGRACCPLCSSPATRVHSHYQRTVADLPCVGKPVRLLVEVRKFFCEVATCPRTIFVERLTPFIAPWARVTTRLCELVQVIGLATGGKLGVRVTAKAGINTSWKTIIRRIMALPEKPVEKVAEVGIDDFSFRRGRKFGSLLVDLQSHEALDVLPDRTAETAKAWLQAHPEIQLVSRDRGGEYASAAREGAPQATQIADRFHLYKNLVEAVEPALVRCRAEIRQSAQANQQVQPLPENRATISVENWRADPDPSAERARLARHAQRADQYQQVVQLFQLGLDHSAIASRTGLSRRTVERWLAHDAWPAAKRRQKRQSVFDPYARYVLDKWEAGERNGSVLFNEIKQQGFAGSERTLYRFLVPLRKNQRIVQNRSAPDAALQDFSAKQAVWLFARDRDDLNEEERTDRYLPGQPDGQHNLRTGAGIPPHAASSRRSEVG